MTLAIVAWRLKMDPLEVYRIVEADYHQYDYEQDPDPDLDPQYSKKLDPDPQEK
jgi:hypothetical protein